jgi:hypothetical protein
MFKVIYNPTRILTAKFSAIISQIHELSLPFIRWFSLTALRALQSAQSNLGAKAEQPVTRAVQTWLPSTFGMRIFCVIWPVIHQPRYSRHPSWSPVQTPQPQQGLAGYALHWLQLERVPSTAAAAAATTTTALVRHHSISESRDVRSTITSSHSLHNESEDQSVSIQLDS